MPYWDAAAVAPMGTSSYPRIVEATTVEVEVPSGHTTTKITIPNPLYAYTFHPIVFEDFQSSDDMEVSALAGNLTMSASDPWILWTSTKRYPSTTDATAVSQDDLVAQSLDRNQANLVQRTYQMLGMQNNYLDVSNNMAESTTQAVPDSLESVHDTLHNTVGRGGHMYDTAYSAFDPIFWLLHTSVPSAAGVDDRQLTVCSNTDRLLAIWQVLHPDSYVESYVNPRGTFTTPPYSRADENTRTYSVLYHPKPFTNFASFAPVPP
jgi:tyrosinase